LLVLKSKNWNFI